MRIAPHVNGALGHRIIAVGLAAVIASSTSPICTALAQSNEDAQQVQAAQAQASVADTATSQDNAAQTQKDAAQTQQATGASSKSATSSQKKTKKKQEKKKTLSKGERAVSIAKKYMGCPYLYGGSGPNSFDCSGFTRYVYAKLGVSLSHNAQAQYGAGTHVSKSNLKKGDLVFFGSSTGSITHVGMYIGGGKFIHAPQTGDVVSIDSLSSRSNCVGACRVA